ncbi:universal stress protein [Magnetospirillum sp. 15-1]|uniref:universal stress protein n=1 Tax=Magnetospirillum sp. 15-1 TaxID=1979370 RepID=UPI000BBC3BA8|nr:universal stress protein [Magnetospirillum sp. 15-1]
MNIKDILVHLDGDSVDSGTLTLAVAQAKRFGARLTGLFARKEISPTAMVARQPSNTLLAQAEAARKAFETATAGLQTRWWQVVHGAETDLLSETVFCSHYVDLVIVSQPAAYGNHVPETMVEQIILNSGRPVLVVPVDYKDRPVGKHVVIGWRSAKQAARALHDCLPLVEGAEQVLVASVRGFSPMDKTLPQVDIIDHLRTHGLPVTGERVNTEGLGVMDSLLSRAYDIDADLLVIGGHPGRSLSFSGKAGAGTRHILAHSSIPVLFSC